MASVSEKCAGGGFSWRRDGHGSPKNSKWLLENLTEVDSKMKRMIEIVDEDGDSFARRAEMYYKKRPELMKLMEEFYSAYRGLAARYDHVTGLLRFDLRLIAEGHHKKLNLPHVSELSVKFLSEEHGSFDVGEMDRNSIASSCGRKDRDSVHDCCSFTDLMSFENSSEFDIRARKSLKDEDEVSQVIGNEGYEYPVDFEGIGELHLEVLSLKAAISVLDSEKQELLVKYQKLEEKMSDLQVQLSQKKEECSMLSERALKAEASVKELKESNEKMDCERSDAIALLEENIAHAEKNLVKLNAGNEFFRVLHSESVEKIATLERQLSKARGDASSSSNRFNEASKEIESLMRKLDVLAAERESADANDRSSAEKIALLEREVELLKTKLDDEAAKCKIAEEEKLRLETRNQSLGFDLDALSKKLADQREEQECETKSLRKKLNEEITKCKNAEEIILLLETKSQSLRSDLGVLSKKLSVQKEERQGECESLRKQLEDEIAKNKAAEERHQNLERKNQALITETVSLTYKFEEQGKELEGKERELQNGLKGNQIHEGMVEELKAAKNSLQAKLSQVKLHNKSLNEVNLSLAVTVKDSKAEMLLLKERILKLEEEIRSLSDMNKTKTREINDTKEELKCLHEKDNSQSLANEVQRLKDENEMLQISSEESYKALQDENSVLVSNNSFLVSQLHTINRTVEKLSQEKSYLEKAHLSANIELQELREKHRIWEDSCHFLEGKVSTRDEELEKLKNRVMMLELDNPKPRSPYAGASESTSASFPPWEVNPNEEQSPREASSQLNELQAKVSNIERLITERETHLIMENTMYKSKLESANKHLEDMKSKKQSSNIEDGKSLTTKEALEDESSESSVGFSTDPFEMWDSNFHKDTIDLTVENLPKSKRKLKEHYRKRSHSFVDKEMTLENLIVSKGFPSTCIEIQDRKILDRLDSDAQKLTKLHVTLQELKRAIESKKGGAYEGVKEQMEEIEEAIIKMFNINLRLKRAVEADVPPTEATSALAYEEKKAVTRRKVSDQIKRMSERIGKLQLDVQFLLIKLEENSKSTKVKISDKKTRV